MEVQLCKAKPEDVDRAVPLIAATMAGFGEVILGLGAKELEFKALSNWFVPRGNRFSHEFCWLAVVNREIAGLLLAFGGNEIPRLEVALAKGIFRVYSPLKLMRMIWRLAAFGRTHEANHDEFLIAHLAVDPKFQRLGIATSLLQKAEFLAHQEKISKLVLEVEIGNTPAENLYQKFGFQHRFTTEFKQHAQALHCPGFHNLVKTI